MVTLKNVKDARERLQGYIKETPLLRAERMDAALGCKVWLKPENLQLTGSFKIRGALNKMLSLTDAERARGIIASSSGNHAQGVAYAARLLGVKVVLVLPENAPRNKIEGCRAMGAEVVLHGFDSIQRYKRLYEIQAEKGYTLVHSYNDPDLIAGQGTAGYEIMQALPDADVVVVPLGGGGLMAGVAVAVKESNPKTRVIGVEPAAIPRYSASRAAGHPVEVPIQPTVADGLMITKTGEHVYPIIEKYVDDLVSVDDEHIVKALRLILMEGRQLVEPSAAVGVAAVLAGDVKVRAEDNVCFLLTGGNIDFERLIELLEAGR
jgi:threonine dehydratase